MLIHTVYFWLDESCPPGEAEAASPKAAGRFWEKSPACATAGPADLPTRPSATRSTRVIRWASRSFSTTPARATTLIRSIPCTRNSSPGMERRGSACRFMISRGDVPPTFRTPAFARPHVVAAAEAQAFALSAESHPYRFPNAQGQNRKEDCRKPCGEHQRVKTSASNCELSVAMPTAVLKPPNENFCVVVSKIVS